MRQATVARKLMFASLLLSQVANARYVQTCLVKYETEDGWSKIYELQVTFMRGSELNEATSTYGYKAYESYATIFWDEGQASVIELERDVCGAYGGNSECEYADFHRSYSGDEASTGLDQKGIKWLICWIDDCR